MVFFVVTEDLNNCLKCGLWVIEKKRCAPLIYFVGKQNKKLKSWYDSIILVLDEEDVEFLDVDNIYQKFIF